MLSVTLRYGIARNPVGIESFTLKHDILDDSEIYYSITGARFSISGKSRNNGKSRECFYNLQWRGTRGQKYCICPHVTTKCKMLISNNYGSRNKLFEVSKYS